MTASRPEGAKGKAREVVLRVGGDEHATPYMWESAIAAALEEYAREQTTCKAHAFRVPPATCCYVGDTISFWDDKFVTAVNEDERVINDLRAQLQTLRGVIESIALVTAYTEPLPGSLAGHVKVLVSDFLQEKAALEAISGKLRDLFVDASYLMQHFKEDDAAYRGWREKGKQVLADLAALAPKAGMSTT